MFDLNQLRISIWLRSRIVYAKEFALVRALRVECEIASKQLTKARVRFDICARELARLEAELMDTRATFGRLVDSEEKGKKTDKTADSKIIEEKKETTALARAELLKVIENLTLLQAAQQAKYEKSKTYFTALEHQEIEAINARLAAENDLQSKIGLMFTEGGTISDRALQIFEKIESKVVAREATATASFSKIQAASEEESKTLERVLASVDKIDDGKNTTKSAFDSLGKLIGFLDPNIENAYKRLENQIQKNRKVVEESEKVEQWLEDSINEHKADAETWGKRAEALDSTDAARTIAPQALSRKKSLDDAAAELSVALNSHRTKNLANSHVLFRVEAIKRRLYFLKTLLAALPVTAKSDLDLFSEFVDSVCRALQNFISEQASTTTESPTLSAQSLNQRLYEIEQGLLLKYIQFAKKNVSNLDRKNAAKFTSDCTVVASALKTERDESKKHLDSWEAVQKQSIKDEMQLLKSVSEQRIEHYLNISKTYEQMIDVLSVVLLAARSVEKIG